MWQGLRSDIRSMIVAGFPRAARVGMAMRSIRSMPGAFRRYWDAVVEPLIADAGRSPAGVGNIFRRIAGKSKSRYGHQHGERKLNRRRGMICSTWLPTIAEKICQSSRDETDRFCRTFRRTMGDLAIGLIIQTFFVDGGASSRKFIHPESGGTAPVPMMPSSASVSARRPE